MDTQKAIVGIKNAADQTRKELQETISQYTEMVWHYEENVTPQSQDWMNLKKIHEMLVRIADAELLLSNINKV